MRLTTLVLLYLSIAIVAFLVGIPSYGTMILQNGNPLTLGCDPNNPAYGAQNGTNGNWVFSNSTGTKYAQCTDSTSILGNFVFWLIVVGFASLILSFSAMYIIPLVMVYGILSIIGFLFMPIDLLLTAAPPFERAIIIVFFNALNMFMAVSFIRGGET